MIFNLYVMLKEGVKFLCREIFICIKIQRKTARISSHNSLLLSRIPLECINIRLALRDNLK